MPKCPKCNGTGKVSPIPLAPAVKCSTCEGKGVVGKQCPKCKGKGKISKLSGDYTCTTCGGKGIIY